MYLLEMIHKSIDKGVRCNLKSCY